MYKKKVNKLGLRKLLFPRVTKMGSMMWAQNIL